MRRSGWPPRLDDRGPAIARSRLTALHVAEALKYFHSPLTATTVSTTFGSRSTNISRKRAGALRLRKGRLHEARGDRWQVGTARPQDVLHICVFIALKCFLRTRARAFMPPAGIVTSPERLGIVR